jgi:hypothetical protein
MNEPITELSFGSSRRGAFSGVNSNPAMGA